MNPHKVDFNNNDNRAEGLGLAGSRARGMGWLAMASAGGGRVGVLAADGGGGSDEGRG